MKKFNRNIIIGVIGGTIIITSIATKMTNDYIGDLKFKINQNNQKIKDISDENKELLATNQNLINKNKNILKENDNLKQQIRLYEEKDNEKQKLVATKKIVFDPENVTILSNVKGEQLEETFNNKKYSSLKGLGDAFADAEQKYGINAMFLLGIVSQESGFGKSDRANRQNNMAGLAVYSDSATGKSFSNKYESIMYLGKLLSKEYVKDRNLKGINEINEVYCPNDDYYWSKSIKKIINDYILKMNTL